MKLLVAMTLYAPLLTACGTDRPVLALPPAALAECQDEPPAPELPAYDWSSIENAKARIAVRDQLMLNYVLAWRTAWGSCKADVAGIKAWREEAGR